MKKIILLSAVVLGFTAMSSQIVFVRELLIVFYGNELSIGFVLASWLLGGALGSAVFGKLSDVIKNKSTVFASILTLLGLILPLDIYAIRSIKSIMGINPGQIVPVSLIALSSVIVLMPICVIMGFLFTLACSIYKEWSSDDTSTIARIYVFEALGSIVGGAAVSVILIGLLDSMYIVSIIGLLNIITAYLFFMRPNNTKAGRLSKVLGASILIIWLLFFPAGIWQKIMSGSIEKQWEGYNIVTSGNSIYGNVVLTKSLSQYSIFDNGLRIYTIPDKLNAEEALHYPLLEHPNPKNVLLIGGGVGGLLSEALKHPIDKCDYVELDPLIIRMAKNFLPKDNLMPFDDPRVRTYNTDGRFFVKTTRDKYDCVIVNIGDPCIAQINRYYTVEFFKEVLRILEPGGIVSFGISSSENYVNPDLARLVRSIHTTLKEVFGDVKIMPGDTAYFIASSDKGGLTYDYNILMKRAVERALDIKYVREYYIASKLSRGRLEYIENISSVKGMINRDFRPIAYYLEMIFWSTRFRQSVISVILKAITPERITIFVLIVCLSILTFGLFLKKSARNFEKSVLLTLAVIGFSGLTIQMAVIFYFQVIYGYLFYKLGVILTSFMVGLAIGGWAALRFLRERRDVRRSFIRMQALFTLFVFLLPALILYLSRQESIAMKWTGSNLIFPMISIMAGAAGGFQFPIAARIYLGESSYLLGSAAGINYGVDLAGSCLGALVTGAILIPVIGLSGACYACGAMSFSCLMMMIFLSRS